MADLRALAVQLVCPRGSQRRRWIDRARHRPTGPPPAPPDRSARLRALMVVDRLPTPRHDGGSARLAEIIRWLHESGVHVTLLPAEPSELDSELVLASVPAAVLRPAVARRFLKRHGELIDLVWFVRPEPYGAHHRPLRRARPRAAVVYDTVDLHEDRLLAQARASGRLVDRLRARQVGRLERTALATADRVLVVTPEEAARAARWTSFDRITVLPSAHHTIDPPVPPFEARSDITFVGSFGHAPNVDAAQHLVDDLAPRLLDRLPDAVVSIVGEGAPEELVRRAPRNVRFLGWVDDLAPVYARTRVAVAPLRYGAGLKGKVGEAMAAGVPVVTTTVGAEGYGATRGQHLLVADDPASFVESVASLYTDRTRWGAVGKDGRQLIAERFSVVAMGQVVHQLVDALAQPATRKGSR